MNKMRHNGDHVSTEDNNHVKPLVPLTTTTGMQPSNIHKVNRNGHNNNEEGSERKTEVLNQCTCPSDRMDSALDLEVLGSRFQYRVPGQHNYRGIPLSGISPPSRLCELESFEVKDEDIIVSGYPKSGTTWLQEIVYLIQHDGQLALSNKSPVYMRVPYLEGEYDGMMLDSVECPRVYKTHLPYQLLPTPILEHKPKIIHILRSPRDTVVSYFHFYRTLTELGKYTGSWEEFLDMFSAGYVCYGNWFKHTRNWWNHRHDSNILVVTYEDMKRDPHSVVVNIAQFCGKTISQDTLNNIVEHTTFENMKNNPMLNFKGVPNIDDSISTFMRKGIIGDWKNHFTVAQNETFQMLCEDQLSDIIDLPYNSKM